MSKKHYIPKYVREMIDRIDATNERLNMFVDLEEAETIGKRLLDLKQQYCDMRQDLNTFIKIIIHVDDEMRFIRNLINFGGNKATELEKKE